MNRENTEQLGILSLYPEGQLRKEHHVARRSIRPAENHYRSQVIAATFGHLAPELRRRYPGTILFTQTEYGHLEPIRSHFEGLPDSPWFYEHVNDFVADKATERGTIYRFKGTFDILPNLSLAAALTRKGRGFLLRDAHVRARE